MAKISPPAAHAAPSLQKAITQTFRANQAKAGAAAGSAVARMWDTSFSIKNARSSWSDMRPAVLAVVSRYYSASQAYGQVYYSACRITAGLGPLPPSVKVSAPLKTARADNVVDPSGLGAFLHAVKGGAMMMDAFNSGRESLSSAVQALVLAGARDWIELASEADPKCAGSRRVTAGTCDYCKALADMGVKVANGGWHRDCLCTSEPAFGKDTGPSPSSPHSSVSDEPEDVDMPEPEDDEYSEDDNEDSEDSEDSEGDDSESAADDEGSPSSAAADDIMQYAAQFTKTAAKVTSNPKTPSPLSVSPAPLTPAQMERFIAIVRAGRAALASQTAKGQ